MRFFRLFFGLVAILIPAVAETTLTPEQRRLNLDSFEYVWSTVRDKHWDAKIGGLDWQAVHDELRPRVEAAQSADEARRIVSSMLDRLHQTHFGVIPSDAYNSIGDTGDTVQTDHGQTGIELRILSGRPIVSRIEAGSSAAAAGVKTGWEIARIEKVEVAPVVSRLLEVSGRSRMTDMMAARAVQSKLDGPVDSAVAVEFSDTSGNRIAKSLKRQVESGEVTRFGFLPPMLVRFESRKLPEGAEYIHFNLFLKPDVVVTRFGEAIQECGRCPGVIVDLRGNPGGIGAMAMGMAGFLISQPDQKLGTMYMRSLPIRFVIFPRAEVYAGPVAILVDGFTASTSEIFAGGMQDLKRARVFGERTAGAALPSRIEKLPNGDGFQYAMANYISESGRQLEGNGVVPDVEVTLDRKALAEGREPVLESALNWVRSQKWPQGASRGFGASIMVVPKSSGEVYRGIGGPKASPASPVGAGMIR